MERMYIYPADLVILTGKKYNACYKMYHLLLDCLGKSKKKKLTIREYCRLEEVDEKEVREYLKG